eukprot:CAMPEP_0182421402 /NCGR_PEP_ID=MMETSP1167-20130531/6780_1 /TAXON_ID=2988 /ORGANISM="Mallomonas Sp, Strain CCMP3275" /LENGTH=637 /DNA_ID=CAMNT_0024598507 /DNA_START=38 /DNA_END=1951 /DNA_ORIENTATION=+
MHKQLTRLLIDGNPLRNYSDTVYATLCLVNICGFSTCSAKLQPEEFTNHINIYLARLLKVIHHNSGDVVKFLGDSILIMWPVDSQASEDIKSATVLMASMCALQLLRDCEEYEYSTDGVKEKLELRCGIACGPVHCMCVGEGNRWEYITTGATVSTVASVVQESEIGELCVSPDAYVCINQHVDGQCTVTGCFKITGHFKPSSTLLARVQNGGKRGSMGGRGSFVERGRGSIGEKGSMQPRSSIIHVLEAAVTAAVGGGNNPSSRPASRRPSDERAVVAATRPPPEAPATSSSISSAAVKANTTSSWIPVPRRSLIDTISGAVASLTATVTSPREKRPSIPSVANVLKSLQLHKMKMLIDTDESVIEAKKYLAEFLDMRSSKVSKSIGNMDESECIVNKCPTISAPLQNISSVQTISEFKRFVLPILRNFVHISARDAVENSTEEYLPELRETATVFVEFIGLQEDLDMGIITRVQSVLVFVLSILNDLEGSLRQYVMDGKGLYVIFAFGLPGSCHENDCVRAINAAIQIRENMKSLGLQTRTGVSYGQIYCGLIGCKEMSCEYGMVGSSVNLAAHIMTTVSLDGILVTDSVYKKSISDFTFIQMEKSLGKGFEGILIFEPVERTRRHSISEFLPQE